MRVLLVSPLRLMGFFCGDDILTTLLLAQPPEGVALTHFSRAMEAGVVRRDHPLGAWFAALAMQQRPPAGVAYDWPGLPPWRYRLLARLLGYARPDEDVQWLECCEPDRFDLLHAYQYPVRLGRQARRLPLVMSNGSGNWDLLRNYNGFSEQEALRLIRRDQRLIRRLGIAHDSLAPEQARLITVPSRYALGLHTALGVPEEKLRLVRIGFPTPSLPAEREDDGTCRFTIVGQGFWRKGGRAIALAFERLHRLHPEARLTIVSNVRPEELGIDPAGVTVIPRLSHAEVYATIYPRTDVYLLPSLAEGYGMSVVEAMSFARPVIASRIGALPELVREGETGRLVAPDSPEALFEAMRALMEDRAERRRLGLAGRRVFEAEHAAEVTNRTLRRVYEEALG